jgi:hypothetical protein
MGRQDHREIPGQNVDLQAFVRARQRVEEWAQARGQTVVARPQQFEAAVDVPAEQVDRMPGTRGRLPERREVGLTVDQVAQAGRVRESPAVTPGFEELRFRDDGSPLLVLVETKGHPSLPF